MDVSSWRFRVLLEPRGFIRFLEVILAIVAFSTTGGYSGVYHYVIACPPNGTQPSENIDVDVTIAYPFRLNAREITFKYCGNSSLMTTRMDGDLSPSSQWFLFVGVTAFLYSLAAVVFYVAFDASIRLTHDRLVTIGDLAVTVLYTFLWLTAASAWAWGLGQVKLWTSHDRFFRNQPLNTICVAATCSAPQPADYSPLNASVAFGFLNFFLWGCNVWFVYKESPYHKEATDGGGMNEAPPNNM